MKRYLKTASIIILINSFALAQGTIPPWETQDPKIYRIEQKIDKLEKVSASLYQLHDQLTSNSKAVLELNKKASDNLKNNIYKVYFKGNLDVYNKVTSPLGSILDLANEIFLNLAVEPALWKTENQKVFINRLNESSYFRNTKLRLMFVTLSALMSYDCARFDDDLQPIANSKKELSELKIKDAERRKVLKETEEWINRMRMKAGYSYDPDKLAIEQTADFDSPEIKQKLSDVRNKLNKNREDDKIKREELERLKKLQIQKEADARVYIDADCPRHVLANERVPMIIRAYPEDIKGIFVLYVDSKEVNRSNKESNSVELGYLFKTPGKYDVQVKLLIRGNYNDTYTDQFYVEKNPTINIPGFSRPNIDTNGPAYDSKLEGKKN